MNSMYETDIGLEVHIELSTKTKIFCACPTSFGGKVNAHTCPVCSGMPGSLPVLNKKVVDYALAIGIATNCKISKHCKFDRKNYFYPDNPQNYQISQLYLPVCYDGGLEIEVNGKTSYIRIHEMHMEEDAGKLIHDALTGCSLVDYNRAGVPLVEIVTKPDMKNADEVIAFLEKLRMIVQYLGASDCKLQEGSMRVDVNLSVRKKGSSELGIRTEMKNLNSFKAMKRAIESETIRQIESLESGRDVLMETRRWDDNEGCSYSMRSKEEARDYRYFPEPDLAPISISDEWIENIRNSQPELVDEKRKRYVTEYNIPEYDINFITSSKLLAELFEKTVALCNEPKEVSNWIITETVRLLKETNMEPENIVIAPENLALLVKLVKSGTINRTVAKEVFEQIFKNNINPEDYVMKNGLCMINDEDEVTKVINEIMDNNPQSVADYIGGKIQAKGYIVGQVMKAMKGKANPGVVNRLVEQELKKRK